MSDQRNAIYDRLSQLISVCPSRSWLDACIQHLNDAEPPILGLDDYCAAVLHQILHSDLRNVVRCSDMENSDPSNISNSNSNLLQRSIAESLNKSSINIRNIDNPIQTNTKISLPQNFRLLVQVEEFLDVSLNAEDRLRLGPTELSSPSPIGNQRMRCLKFALSDGYSNSGTTSCIIALEVNPIPNLSVNSQPGVKVLLRGPMTVRMGMLLLNEFNALVLGGCVAELIPIQKKARDMAARIAGIGVDPTVKALIGNANKEVEEDQDEGEQASVDVTEKAQSTVTRNSYTDNHRLHTNIDTRVALDSAILMRSLTNSTTTAIHKPILDTQILFPSTLETTKETNPSHPDKKVYGITGRKVSNPYSKFSIAAESSSVKSRDYESSIDDLFHGNDHTMTENNLLNDPAASFTKQTSHGKSAVQSFILNINDDISAMQSSVSNVDDTLVVDKTDMPVVMFPKTHIPNGPNLAHMDLDLSPTALSTVLSFKDLRLLLEFLLKDPVVYSSYEGKLFVVPSKLAPPPQPPLSFRIEKNKNRKSKSEKYHYGMTVKMSGLDVIDGFITCRVSNSILEECIGMSPDQLRHLHRNEATRQKADGYINEGAKMALTCLKNLVSCNFTLFLPKDEAFSSSGISVSQIDGEHPLLQLVSYK